MVKVRTKADVSHDVHSISVFISLAGGRDGREYRFIHDALARLELDAMKAVPDAEPCDCEGLDLGFAAGGRYCI